MGMILDDVEGYGIEVRGESFKIHGAEMADYIHCNTDKEPKHVIYAHSYLYNPVTDRNIENYGRERAYWGSSVGYAEFLIEDIPRIRAVLDAVENYVQSR
jgi:hypothetical protein